MKNLDLTKLGSSDLLSYEKVLKSYRENSQSEEIFESGFNTNSGYVYLALENGVTIASCFGQDVDFIVTDFDNGDEYFFDCYEDAIKKQCDIYS